jgi:putative two-component system response regulator
MTAGKSLTTRVPEPETDDVRHPVEGLAETKRRFFARKKHDLLDSMGHIIGYGEILIEAAQTRDCNAIIQELRAIHADGKRLVELAQELFSEKEGIRPRWSIICHQLRIPATRILGLGEVLLEYLEDRDSDLSPRAFIPDLQKILSAVRQLLALLDGQTWPPEKKIVSFMPAVPPPPVLATPAPTPSEAGVVLVVDDSALNREILTRHLQTIGHAVDTAENGREALARLHARQYDLILLDVVMPEMNGYELLAYLRRHEQLQHIPVLMISAMDDLGNVVACIEAGAEDFLGKPFEPTLLKARVNASLEKKRLHDREQGYLRQIKEYNLHLESRVHHQVHEITAAQLSMIFALSKLSESRDPETGGHLERVREYTRLLAQGLHRTSARFADIDDEYIETLYVASPLHDIGKVGIPDHILQKPGKLTEAEFEIMKTHTLLGANTLRAVETRHSGNRFVRCGIEIAESHHEKWDGTGYPHGLKGERIPLSARIFALADVYDALRARRCYKEPMSHEEALGIVVGNSGKHFDPDVIQAFLACQEEFSTVSENFGEPGLPDMLGEKPEGA